MNGVIGALLSLVVVVGAGFGFAWAMLASTQALFDWPGEITFIKVFALWLIMVGIKNFAKSNKE